MKGLLLLLAVLAASPSAAQTVLPDEVSLTVSAEDVAEAPFVGEMVLLTIHGVYRRHVTLEKLQQPDLDGFSWMQLGDDYWYESMLGGRPVKNMRRRMALFPERAGRLTIGPFVHHLTLVDEEDDWFEHEVASEPITIDVRPQPEVPGWWLPVKWLEVSDNWSNAPDQLAPGEGVLRIIRVEAVGIAPERLPPMPELRSPSGQIFPHPEKRLVSLSPEGPISTAFWRWTIKPEGPSAIIEPIEFSYFDTRARVMRDVVISPQRVATTPGAATPGSAGVPPSGRLHRASALAAIAAAALAGIVMLVWRRTASPRAWAALGRSISARHDLARAARAQDLAGFRRAANRLAAAGDAGEPSAAVDVLKPVDAALFSRNQARPDLRPLRRDLLRALRG